MQNISNSFLPVNFIPGAQHVVISKGKKYCQHSGNLYLRSIVQSKLSIYLNATSKVSKSCIISSVIDQIHDEGGFFVQLQKDTGRWIKAGDYLTREKTSQAFRDALRHQYKSSRQNKRRIKMEDHDSTTIISNPLLIDDITSAARQQSRKRRRTENTFTLTGTSTTTATVVTPNTSLSSLEFPMLPLPPRSVASCPHQLYDTIPSTQNEKDNKEEIDNDLFTSLCLSLLAADDTVFADMNDYQNSVVEGDSLYEPIPLDEIIITPIHASCSNATFPRNQQTTDDENAFYQHDATPLQQIMVKDNNNESEETLLLRSALTRIVSDC